LEMFGRRLLRQPAIPIAVLVWTAGFAVLDFVMWWNGRFTLLNNIVISIPLVISAIMLTQLLIRLQAGMKSRSFETRTIAIIFAIVAIAALQWWIDYAAAWLFALTIFPDWQRYLAQFGTSNFAFGTYVYAILFSVCMLLHAFA